MAKDKMIKSAGDALAGFDCTPEELSKAGFKIEHFIQFRAGMTIRGRYAGPGGDIETMNKKTGEIRSLPTFKVASLKDDNVIGILLGTAQLKSRFSGTAIGSEVCVVHLGKTELEGGHTVNGYDFWAKEAKK